MMLAGGLVLSGTLIFFAGWLQWTEHRGWPHDHFNGDDDQEYLRQRMKSRRVVNCLIGICGVLILAATLTGKGPFFIAAWSCVSLILMVIVMLAGLDAFRTLRHQKQKLRRLKDSLKE